MNKFRIYRCIVYIYFQKNQIEIQKSSYNLLKTSILKIEDLVADSVEPKYNQWAQYEIVKENT